MVLHHGLDSITVIYGGLFNIHLFDEYKNYTKSLNTLRRKIAFNRICSSFFFAEKSRTNKKNKRNCLCIHRLPRYATKFIEMCLMVTADHGPAVSGAHNTIVCARAGKDLISCLASGLLTIVSWLGPHLLFWLWPDHCT